MRIICPAVILAASRKESVTGRKMILVVSMRTKKGFNHAGAPPGSRDAAAVDGEYDAPDRINESHRGNPKEKVKISWHEFLNT